jgi:succinyl-CoA synthetase alpha subunit
VELPVFGSSRRPWPETGANVSVLFVPPAFTKDAAIEAIDAEIGLIVVITEGVPVQDTAEVWSYLQGKSTRMIGPNCPGIITPGESLAGITPHTIAGKGPIGLVSKSGTLTYQMMYELRTSASPPPSASAATRSSAPPTSTPSRRSRTTRRPRRS